MSSPADLDRRLSKKIESGKAIQLSAEDLCLFVASGAIDTFREFVTEYQRAQCLERNALNRFTNAENSPSTHAASGTSKSFGTTPTSDVSEAQARVAAILKKAA